MPKRKQKPEEKKAEAFSLTVKKLAGLLGRSFEGNGKTEIRGVASPEKARKGDLVFFGQPKFRGLLDSSEASAAIIPAAEKYERIPVIKSENPHLDFIKVVELFCQPYRPEAGINPAAVVSSSAKIGKGVAVGAFVYIGDKAEIGEKTVIFPFAAIYPGAKIGRECVIHSHVSVREGVQVGNRVIIHNGAVIGSDGFGYLEGKAGSRVKIPQVGTVVIEDDVEIGANTCIDRATLGETIIRKGVKIDNLVQVAHNVEIGEHSVLAALVGIGGSTKIGKRVMIGGQAGAADHLKIGDDVKIAGKSGVTNDLPDGAVVAGYPHMDIREWRKTRALLPQLYDLVKDIRALKKKVEELEKKIEK